MRLKLSLILMTLLIGQTSVYADTTTPPATTDLTPLSITTTAQGLPVSQAGRVGNGGSESAAGVTGYGAGIAPKASAGAINALAVCNNWWVHGSHQYKYTYLLLGIRNSLTAQTDTYYGTATDPNACAKPALVVDQIYVEAQTIKAYPPVLVKKTAYNTSYISASDRVTAVGGGLSIPCGAAGYHEAIKSGIKWSTRTASGCAP